MAFEFINSISRGLFGGSVSGVKTGGTVITGVNFNHIFGGIKSIFPGNHETLDQPLPPARHVFRTGIPKINLNFNSAAPIILGVGTSNQGPIKAVKPQR